MRQNDAVDNSPRFYKGDGSAEQPIELRRHFEVLRRWRRPIAAMVLGTTAAALALSLILPKTYSATAKILFDPTQNPAAAQDSQSVERQLSTFSSLVTTPTVLGPVAAKHGLSLKKMQAKVSSSASQSANLVNVTATDRHPSTAQSIANDAAHSFIDTRAAADRKNIKSAQAKVLDEIASIGAAPNADLELQALKARLSELTVALANSGSEVQLAEAAQKPESPSSPRVVLNTLLAFFASSLVAVLFAVGREQLVPRVSDPRELARITDRSVLGEIPFVRRRFGRAPKVLSGTEYEAYQTLQATIRFQLPPEEQHIILVTSAIEGEGKTSVTTNLGRALARAGEKTLLVSADLRRPTLHEHFGMSPAIGFSDILEVFARQGGSSPDASGSLVKEMLDDHAQTKGYLHILASGKTPPDPAGLLLSDALPAFFEHLRALDYKYVLLDGPPLLGIADAQALAQRVNDILLVTRLDRATLDNVVDVRDVLDRLEVTPLGYVVVGGRRMMSYYYASTAAPAPERV